MVEYTNNSAKIKTAINTAVKNFLTEAGGEVQKSAFDISRTKNGQTKGSYKYKVITGDDEGTVYVGSNLQNAIWEEFGTGEYALNGDGRKGYWIYLQGRSSGSKGGKSYDLKGAKKAMAILRKKGLPAIYTNGKKPNRTLYKAFNEKKGKLEARLAEVLKSI